MVYFAMALALFAEEDYEEVAARLTETLASWRCWDDSWSLPTSGSYLSIVVRPAIHDKARNKLIAAARDEKSTLILARRCGCGSSSTRFLTATVTAAAS